jgi:hypothetical protein
MAVYVEDYLPVVKFNGLNTAKDVSLAGTNTVSGALNVTGATAFSGATTGVRKEFEVVTGDKTVTAAMSGRVFQATKSSATQTFTLPAATTAGLTYTFICGHASGEILINGGTGYAFSIKASEGGASVVTADNTGIKNTAASNVVGDHITLVSDGVKTWHAIAQSGTWASQ